MICWIQGACMFTGEHLGMEEVKNKAGGSSGIRYVIGRRANNHIWGISKNRHGLKIHAFWFRTHESGISKHDWTKTSKTNRFIVTRGFLQKERLSYTLMPACRERNRVLPLYSFCTPWSMLPVAQSINQSITFCKKTVILQQKRKKNYVIFREWRRHVSLLDLWRNNPDDNHNDTPLGTTLNVTVSS